MRDAPGGVSGWIVRRLPAAVRERYFAPAYYDLAAECLAARESAPVWLVPAHTALFRLRVFIAACEAARIALAIRDREAPRARRQRTVDRMVFQDLRFAVRVLRKQTGFTLLAVAILALGIGANTAMFSLVHAVLLRPLPYRDPARIVRIHESARGRLQSVAPPNYLDWRAESRTLGPIAAFQDGSMTYGSGSAPERLSAAFVTADVFRVLGVGAALGRTFGEVDDHPGSARVVLLGHGMWQSRLAGDPSIVGRTLRFDGRAYEVVGVMPAGFTFPGDIQLWFPLILTDNDTNPGQRGAHYLDVIARLAPGATVAQAQDDMTRVEQAIAAQHAKVQGYGVWIEPLLDSMVGDVRRPLVVFLGAVACVLLIACVNVSNLLLTRGASRRAEVALRAAIGASRWQIVRQFLIESLLLSLSGGIAGVLLAVWAVRALPALLPGDLPRSGGLSIDAPVLAFSLLMTFATGLVFGIVPAVQSSSPDASACLKEARRDGGTTGRRSIRRALIAFEMAAALVLLAGAGITIRSFERLSRVDPGFDPGGVLSFRISVPGVRYPTRPAITTFFRDFLDSLRTMPGVTAAGAVMVPPLSTSGLGGTFTIIGRSDGNDQRWQVRPSTPGYFEALRIPIVRGRGLTSADRDGAPLVAVISGEAARRFWPGEDPIGKRVRIHVSLGVPEREREIVGVVGDVKIRTLEAPHTPVVYVPHAQYVDEEMTVFVRTSRDPMDLLPGVRAALARLDREIPLTAVRTGATLVDRASAQPRFRMRVLVSFAVMAMALAAIGLYAVMVDAVSQRRHELGLRLALGAESRDLLRLVLRDGFQPVALGLAVGWPTAAALTRLLSTLLFEVQPLDPITFAAAPIVLASAAALACYVPARRAARSDPSAALRS